MSKAKLTGKGRRWLESGHLWIYRDDLAQLPAEDGGICELEGPRGESLGFAAYSAASRIALRLITRRKEAPDAAFWRARVQAAVERRARLGLSDPAGAARLIAGDADGVPGLVVDRYADALVVQSGTLFADRMRDSILESVRAVLEQPIRCVVERSDASVRRLESLEERKSVLEGELPSELLVREDQLVFEVDLLGGHKTGHYLDQRENRRRASAHARGRRCLDVFCYDGLFGIRMALQGAAEVLCIDQSQAALERVQRNAARNGVAERVRVHKADALHDLRARVEAGERYGLVVVDPPAFAKNRAQVEGARRGYTELHRRGIELTEPGGHFVSASCSYNVRAHEFVELVRDGAALARREAWLLALEGAAPDHPHLLTLPETHYLKCAFVAVGARTD